jgi:hypothetical protein
MPVDGVRPDDTPVCEPGQQGIVGERAEALPVPARVMRRPGRSMSSRVSSRMALGRAACTAASAMARRWAGVTAACPAARISSAVIGSKMRPAPRPPPRCRVRSANVRPRRFANRNSCALASFLVVVVLRGGGASGLARTGRAASSWQAGHQAAVLSFLLSLSPCACQPSISSIRSRGRGCWVVAGMMLCALARAAAGRCAGVRDDLVIDRSPDSSRVHCLRLADGADATFARLWIVDTLTSDVD